MLLGNKTTTKAKNNLKKNRFSKRRFESDLEDKRMNFLNDSTAKFIILTKSNSFLEFELMPLIGDYAFLKFQLRINIQDDYPFSTPQIVCSNKIKHPNCYPFSGELCVQMTSQEKWDPTLTIYDVIIAVKNTILFVDSSYIPKKRENIALTLFMNNKIKDDYEEDKLSLQTDDGQNIAESVSKCDAFLETFKVPQVNRLKYQFCSDQNDTDQEEDVDIKVDLSKRNRQRKLNQLDKQIF